LCIQHVLTFYCTRIVTFCNFFIELILSTQTLYWLQIFIGFNYYWMRERNWIYAYFLMFNGIIIHCYLWFLFMYFQRIVTQRNVYYRIVLKSRLRIPDFEFNFYIVWSEHFCLIQLHANMWIMMSLDLSSKVLLLFDTTSF